MMLLLFEILAEKAEVAMAVLPLILEARTGACQHEDFVEFISVNINDNAWVLCKLTQTHVKVFYYTSN